MDFVDSHGKTVTLPPGTDVAWRVSGYAIIKNQRSQFLLVQSGNGLWHFPGGGIEQTEIITAGIVRECLEETGYSITITDDQPYFLHEQRFYHSREQAFYHSIQLFYAATLSNPLPNLDAISERDRARKTAWLGLDELTAANTHPTIAVLVVKLKA